MKFFPIYSNIPYPHPISTSNQYQYQHIHNLPPICTPVQKHEWQSILERRTLHLSHRSSHGSRMSRGAAWCQLENSLKQHVDHVLCNGMQSTSLMEKHSISKVVGGTVNKPSMLAQATVCSICSTTCRMHILDQPSQPDAFLFPPPNNYHIHIS